MTTDGTNRDDTDTPTPAVGEPVGPPSRVRMLGPIVLMAIATLLTGALIVRTALHFRPKPVEDLGAMPTFSLTDQAGATFTDKDLAGKAWVVDFFFSRCTGVCPRLAERMRSIGRFLDGDPRYGPRTGLLSITVDPDNDKPEVLAEYARRERVDASRWRLATGSSKVLEDVVVKGFHMAMGTPETDPATGRMDILHGSHLVLIDPRGRIRGYYDSNLEGQKQLERDLARVLDEKPAAGAGEGQ